MKSQFGGVRKKLKDKDKEGTIEDRKTAEDDEVSLTEDVRGAEYYHGLVPKADVEPLMKNDGDFLLRKTETNGQIVIALSVRHEGKTRHFMINQDPEGFYVETHREKTIAELISYHRGSKEPLSSTSPAILKRPVERPLWILNHDCIRLGKKLGEGAFGEVYLAEYTEFGGKEKKEVAVKTMREQATREARMKFMKEARLMRRYKHRNVVQFLGVAVHEHPLMIVMEFCPGGSLLSYLRKEKGKTTPSTKHRFALEAAAGLMYLERQKCIHRDIAARNCLLSSKIEVKISDFGMSDNSVFMLEDKLDKVPVKWLAPETLQQKIYSSKTDVWSFGVLVWEIYSDGSEPYPGLSNIQTRAKIVVQNYRMEFPKDCAKQISALVLTCWDKEPTKRPDFAKIHRTLKELKDRSQQGNVAT